MGAKAGFWNFLAKRYARMSISDMDSYEFKLEKTREYFNSESEVFEFGCGTGSTAILHSPFVQSILAVDFSPKMIEIAHSKLSEHQVSNVTFEQTDIDSLPDGHGPFDVVMGMSILHLLDDKDAVLARVTDLLKPGGVFISSTACIGGAGGLLRGSLKTGGALRLLPHIDFFTLDELLQSMRDAGLEVEYQWQPNDKAAAFIVARKPV
ncbi:Ubiquinone/menaquinone biosynthesis C-methylase UbiE [Shimia gijangensis]|uniref:Ubiquinone/menaquinone biosynthesis C-methylase UbiE n=2 Tax=Shimia gijangensis TaxID=1470563 RepID=A0A1M6MMY1_9RHOB|nr:Ubiquinone/menaquinone biosynthesis C-methylase UbiE [Shimia gijangensis]